jgi:hypothetical protein
MQNCGAAMSDHAHPPALELTVAGVIVANTGLMLWGFADHEHEHLIEHLETACLVFFGLELMVRLWLQRWSFFRSPWCIADSVIIVLSLLPMLGAGVTMLRVGRLARLAHLGRHLTLLRVGRLVVLAHMSVSRA